MKLDYSYDLLKVPCFICTSVNLGGLPSLKSGFFFAIHFPSSVLTTIISRSNSAKPNIIVQCVEEGCTSLANASTDSRISVLPVSSIKTSRYFCFASAYPLTSQIGSPSTGRGWNGASVVHPARNGARVEPVRFPVDRPFQGKFFTPESSGLLARA